MSRRYAVVDIETNGSSIREAKITEIAIVVVENRKIIDTFSSLVNPDSPIPAFITQLTGISQEMVERAPSLLSIADKIMHKLENAVFVAHNVNFDYSIIQNQLTSIGYRFSMEKLCSVKLSRKHFPGMSSYSLGKLTASLDIELRNRHRALGDAQATAELLIKILEKTDGNIHISQEVIDKLPTNFKKNFVIDLPDRPGYFVLKDREGRNLFTYAAQSIQQGFIKKLNSRSFLQALEKVHNIDFEVFQNSFDAAIKANQVIYTENPAYNQRLDRYNYWGLTEHQSLFERYFTLQRKCDAFSLIPKFKSKKNVIKYLVDKSRSDGLPISLIKGLPEEVYLLDKATGINSYEFSRQFDDQHCVYLSPSSSKDELHFYYIQDYKYIGYGVFPVGEVISREKVLDRLFQDPLSDIHAALLYEEIDKKNNITKHLIRN